MSCAWTFEAIGTHWSIDTPLPLPPATRRGVADLVERFDRDWSRFRDDSIVTAMASRPGRHLLPADADALLSFYDRLGDLTGGAVNPLVGRGLEELGYDAAYSLRPRGQGLVAPGWGSARRGHDDAGHPWIETDAPVVLDVGAVGKGFLVDLVAEQLGVSAAGGGLTVDAGGDLRRSGPAIQVALEHPADPTRAVGVVHLGDGTRAALAGSSVNRRRWPGADGVDLHHVLDARTGRPHDGVRATWALADDAATADAAATALFFTDPPTVAAEFGVDWVVLDADGRLAGSPHLSGELFA